MIDEEHNNKTTFFYIYILVMWYSDVAMQTLETFKVFQCEQ